MESVEPAKELGYSEKPAKESNRRSYRDKNNAFVKSTGKAKRADLNPCTVG
tara:strand:+ start:539 stop:691 length:153 start_codon:yes stop_codon:yes gene_type:complete